MFLSIDGDSIGKILEQYILDENLKELSSFSKNIKDDIDGFVSLIKENEGTIYMDGGDNLFAYIENKNINKIIDCVKQKNINNKYTFSVGIADSISDTYLALKYAKAKDLKQKYVRLIRSNETVQFEML